MPYVKDRDGDIYKLNILQAIVKENAQGWTRLTDSEVREHFAQINLSAKTKKRTEDNTKSRQLADTNQMLLYDAATSSEPAKHHHTSDSGHHSSHHHNHDSSSHHSHSLHSYDHSSGSHDCGSSDYGSGDAGF